MYRSRGVGGLLALAFSVTACAAQPALVNPANAAASFGRTAGPSDDDPELVAAARACMARLDEHRNAASQGGTTRLALTIVGSAVGGGGGSAGGLISLLGSDQNARTAGNILAISGAVVGAVGTSLGAGVADPAARLALRARGVRHYNTAQLLADQMRRETDLPRRATLRAEVLWNLQVCRADGDATRVPRPASVPARNIELLQ